MSKNGTNSKRHNELLQGAVEWVLNNPMESFSLRNLAKDLDTSARMLIYHFGSRDQLLVEVLSAIADSQLSDYHLAGSGPLHERLQTRWNAYFETEASRRLIVLTTEIWANWLLTRNPIYKSYMDRIIGDWIGAITAQFLEAGMDAETAEARATLVVAAADGFILHMFTDKDIKVEAAADELFANVRRWIADIG